MRLIIASILIGLLVGSTAYPMSDQLREFKMDVPTDEQLSEQSIIAPAIEGSSVNLRQSIFYDVKSHDLDYAITQRLRTFEISKPYCIIGLELGYVTSEKITVAATYNVEWLLDKLVEGGQGIVFFSDMTLGWGLAYDFKCDEWRQGAMMTFLKIDALKLLDSIGVTK